MKDLFYTPEPDDKPDLVAGLLRMAGFDYRPVSEVPKFEQGENVKMEDGFTGEIGGYVHGEPYLGLGNNGVEEWFYPIEVYDKEGPRGLEVWPEHELYRSKSYDEPGQSTMEDWMGITPEAEEYYRTAGADPWGEMLQPQEQNPQEWYERAIKNSPFPFIYSPEQKWIRWGERNGLHDNIINELAQEGIRVGPDAYFGRFFPDQDRTSGLDVVIYDKRFNELPWSTQRRIRDLIWLNAPTTKDNLGL